MKNSIVIIFCLLCITASAQLSRVHHFGRNKGHLKMFIHIPEGMDLHQKAPLVVVLHGCTQSASEIAAQTGWNKLADQYHFLVLYPQQRFFNNPQRCFKWYKRKHVNKNRGENYSILRMVQKMEHDYSIDSSRIFITGLSAGAAMSVVMMADYPEMFNAGSIFAGAAYKVGLGYIPATMAMAGWRIKTPEKWGDVVRRQNPDYKGPFPRIIIFQGNHDMVVNKKNGEELMKQWTNLSGISQSATRVIPSFAGFPELQKNYYKKADGSDAVVFYRVDGLNHAVMVDPGRCPCQGGSRGLFSKNNGFNSTLWAAYDMGLLKKPEISGKQLVRKLEKQLVFFVDAKEGAKYEWSFPEGCIITGGGTTGAVTVDWGSTSGNINVTEIDESGCRKQFETLAVEMEM